MYSAVAAEDYCDHAGDGDEDDRMFYEKNSVRVDVFWVLWVEYVCLFERWECVDLVLSREVLIVSIVVVILRALRVARHGILVVMKARSVGLATRGVGGASAVGVGAVVICVSVVVVGGLFLVVVVGSVALEENKMLQ